MTARLIARSFRHEILAFHIFPLPETALILIALIRHSLNENIDHLNGKT